MRLVKTTSRFNNFERALTEAGYKVNAAVDAMCAEALALEGVHDAFIIDLWLPIELVWI